MSIASLIRHAADAWPDRIALVDDASGERHTFRQLADQVFAMGAGLLALDGVGTGDRIALLGDATPDFLFADYGTMSAGLVRVCLDPALNAQELASQLADAGARVLLHDAAHAELAADVRRRRPDSLLTVRSIAEVARGGTGALHASCGPDDIAALNYTGGTTGTPKAVVHTHGSLSAVLQNIVMARAAWCGGVMLNVRPLWPIASVLQLGHLLGGNTLVLGGHFDARRFLDLVERHRPTCTSLVPTHLVRILRELEQTPMAAPSSLQCIEVSAGAMSPALLAEAVEVFGPVFSVIYGLTEAPWACYRNPQALGGILAEPAAHEGLVGAPTFGSEIRIEGADGPLPRGECGEILLRGAHLMRGYWQQPTLTEQVMDKGWFRTGDLGLLDDQGRLCVRGRIKDIIRSGGKSVQPKEVEDVLRQHEAVADVAVLGLPDAEWGEVVAAAVVLHPGSSATAEALREFCRQHLSGHKRPRRIAFMEQLPRSHYGKVQTGKVRELLTGADAPH